MSIIQIYISDISGLPNVLVTLRSGGDFLWGIRLLYISKESQLLTWWLGWTSQSPVCGFAQYSHRCWVCKSCCGHAFNN